MNYISVIFSMLLIWGSLLFIFGGIGIIQLNLKLNIQRFFLFLSIAFYLGAILVLVFGNIPVLARKEFLENPLLKSLTLMGIGMAINIISRIENEEIKENLIIFGLVLSIPLVILQYVDYGSVTVWAFPVIIIISSIVFKRIALLLLTTVVAITTQILIWMMTPEVTVIVNKYDYLLRIGLFLVAFLIGLYIKRMYVGQSQKNQEQMVFQEMVSDVLFASVTLNEENFDEQVDIMLEQVGTFFNVDRSYFFTIDYEKQSFIYSNEWGQSRIKDEASSKTELLLADFPWWMNQLAQKKLVIIEDVALMPKGASKEQKILNERKVKSSVSVPVMGDAEMFGFIGLESTQSYKEWSAEHVEMLNIMSQILYSGLLQIEADKKIEQLAYCDPLTQLPNRFLFDERVEEAIHLAEEKENYLAIILIDLDNFKTVNDTIGHNGGDELLKQVAKILSDAIPETATIARFGGDEFVILIDELTDDQVISDVSDQIMKVFTHLFVVKEEEFLVTASAGIAVYPCDGQNTDTLVKNADIAMYEAKDKGKNQYAFCTQAIKNEVQTTSNLKNDLYHALEGNEFEIYYQPQMDLARNKIIGVEALLRWNHSTKGIISPGIFIPLAEEMGLINQIGEWVLRTAAIQNKKWQTDGLDPMVMAVNLSAVQIINPKIVETVEAILQETGLEAKYIELEITESVAIKEADYFIDVLNRLKKTGVSIAIDDFGTEYSSLSRLKLLPIDRIKIDMQFVQGIETNEKDRAITMIIIKLAKSLGLNVLAEGVETALQLDFLNQEECQFTQGYYHYKPMPADEIEAELYMHQ